MIDEIFFSREHKLPAGEIDEEQESLSDEFQSMLTKEQVKMFHKLCNMQSGTAVDEVKTAFIVGFKDEITLMTEIKDK